MKLKLKNRMLACTLGFVVMVLAIGLFSGCGEQPLGPAVSNDDPVVVNNSGEKFNGRSINNGGSIEAGVLDGLITGTSLAVEKSTSKLVGVIGGSLETSLPSGGTRFAVPYLGVDELVRIHMRVKQVKLDGKYCTVYEFGPSGLEFNRASTLTLTLPYPEGTPVSLRWFNPTTNQWELQASKPVRSGKVQFSIYHFSKYGIN